MVTVAAAAPAFAASPCVTDYAYRLDWGTTPYTKNSTNLGTATVAGPAAGAQPVTVQFASAYISNNGADRRAAENLTVPATTNIGNLGPTERGLRVAHSSTQDNRNRRQEVTITFSRAVTGLAFTITDVDSGANSWWDQVELSGTRSFTIANPTAVTGAGVAGNPWRAASNNTQLANTSSSGNVSVSYPGAVTSITLTFWSSVSGGTQLINLSDFTFSTQGC